MKEKICDRLIMASFLGENAEVLTYLKDPNLPNIRIIKDKKKMNYQKVIHICCLNNNYYLLNLLVEKAKEQGATSVELCNWINECNHDDVRPIHLAALKGSLEIIKFLELLGADIESRNTGGLTVLHYAAQNDQVKTLVNIHLKKMYFALKGLDTQETDNSGSTCLHWACYMGCENSISFLCNYMNLDQRDNENGYTPLHLAILSGNIRCVRILVSKGASLKCKDKAERSPIVFAQNLDHHAIFCFLKKCESSLGRPVYVPPFNRKSYISLFAFYQILVFLSTTLVFFPCFSCLHIDLTYWQIIIAYGIVFTFCSIFYTLVCIKSPGKSEKQIIDEESFKTLNQFHNKEICYDCMNVKNEKSKHCIVCKGCIHEFDHHCPWINNCIGKNNQGYFIIFLLILFIQICFSITVSFWAISKKSIIHNLLGLSELDFWFNLKIVIGCISFAGHIFLFFGILNLICSQLGNYIKKNGSTKRKKIDSNDQEYFLKKSDTETTVGDNLK